MALPVVLARNSSTFLRSFDAQTRVPAPLALKSATLLDEIPCEVGMCLLKVD